MKTDMFYMALFAAGTPIAIASWPWWSVLICLVGVSGEVSRVWRPRGRY